MITGGIVTFEQSRKLAEYENRKVSITFNVNDEQGAEQQVIAALALAKLHVLKALGLATADAKVEDLAEVVPAGKEKKPRAKAEQKASAPTITATAIDNMVEAENAALKPQIEKITEIMEKNGAAVKADPAAMSDTSPSQTAEDPLGFLNSPAATVTDKELTEAAIRKNAELKTKTPNHAKMIRAVADQFAPFPKTLSDIPTDKRLEFLQKLGELKA